MEKPGCKPLPNAFYKIMARPTPFPPRLEQDIISEYWSLFQEARQDYAELTADERKQTQEKNARVQEAISRHRKETAPPLRSLFIQALMHDLQLNRLDLATSVRPSLVQSRFALKTFIHERIAAGEQIEPDELVERTAQQCRHNPDLLLSALGQWIKDETKRKLFTVKLQLEKQKGKRNNSWLGQVILGCSEFITIKDAKSFEAYFNMLECAMLCEK